LEASFTLTEEEYIRANKLFTRLSRKSLVIYGVVGVSLAIIAFLADSLVLRLGAIGAIFGGIIGDQFVRKIYAPRQTRKQFRIYKAIQEPVHVSKQSDGLVFENSMGNSKINWDRIVKWREDQDLLLIYQAPQVYHIIPKRIGELASDISKALTEKTGAAS